MPDKRPPEQRPPPPKRPRQEQGRARRLASPSDRSEADVPLVQRLQQQQRQLHASSARGLGEQVKQAAGSKRSKAGSGHGDRPEKGSRSRSRSREPLQQRQQQVPGSRSIGRQEQQQQQQRRVQLQGDDSSSSSDEGDDDDMVYLEEVRDEACRSTRVSSYWPVRAVGWWQKCRVLLAEPPALLLEK